MVYMYRSSFQGVFSRHLLLGRLNVDESLGREGHDQESWTATGPSWKKAPVGNGESKYNHGNLRVMPLPPPKKQGPEKAFFSGTMVVNSPSYFLGWVALGEVPLDCHDIKRRDDGKGKSRRNYESVGC